MFRSYKKKKIFLFLHLVDSNRDYLGDAFFSGIILNMYELNVKKWCKLHKLSMSIGGKNKCLN